MMNDAAVRDLLVSLASLPPDVRLKPSNESTTEADAEEAESKQRVCLPTTQHTASG